MSDSQDFGARDRFNARDGFAARDADEGQQLPDELQAVHRQLLRDGAAWRTTVPDNARLNTRVRTLPLESPRSNPIRERDVGVGVEAWRGATRADESSDESDSLLVEDLTRGATMRNGMARKIGAWAGGAAAMLVALLLVGLLVRMANGQPGSHREVGSGTVGVPPTPAVSTSTPTSGSKYVTSAVTASHIDGNGDPVNPTSTFQTGQQIFVVAHVSNPPAGQHHLTIWWFLNGQQDGAVAEGVSGKTVTSSGNVYFTAVYASAGRGTARLYWDMLTNTDLDPDAFLARDVAFDVQGPAGAPTATPHPGITPTPGPTIVPTPTPPPTPTPTPSG